MQAVKFADGSDDTIEGLLMPYGGPANGRDLTGEYFSPRTNFALDWFSERPLLYQHGLDADVRLEAVGTIKAVELRDSGGWMQAQLKKSSAYWSEIKQLVDAGKLFLSSGTMEHLIEKTPSGEIKAWPLIEGTLTPNPANPFAALALKSALGHFEAAGLGTPAVKALLATKAASDTGYDVEDNEFGAKRSQFAYVDEQGRGHLPLHDAAHVRAAMARFDQTRGIPADKKKAVARKILAAARRFKIEIADDSGVADAAKSLALWALKAMTEGSDTGGGFMADEDNAADDNDGDGDEANLANVAHTATRTHTHTHSDDTTHRHGHHHDRGEPSHDTDTHTHPVPVPASYKARKNLDDMECSFEDLRDDLTALLNPGGPYATGYTYIVATYPDHVICCRRDGDGDGDDDDTYWRVDYTIGPDMEPVLGASTQVEQTWTPVASKALGPLSLDVQRSAREAAALASRTKGVAERRATEHRPLSDAATHACKAAIGQWEAAIRETAATVAASEALKVARAKAAHLETPEAQRALRARLALLALEAEELAPIIA